METSIEGSSTCCFLSLMTSRFLNSFYFTLHDLFHQMAQIPVKMSLDFRKTLYLQNQAKFLMMMLYHSNLAFTSFNCQSVAQLEMIFCEDLESLWVEDPLGSK